MPGVVVAFIWLWMYQPQYGAINGLLTLLGLGAWRTAWLGQPATALPARPARQRLAPLGLRHD